MSKIKYRDIIHKAAKITWENKKLWWFGFFASLMSVGSSSSGNGENFPGGKITEEKVADFITNHVTFVIGAGMFLFILFILFLVLRVIGRGALIKSIEKVIKKEAVSFKPGMKEGKKYFWRVLGIGFMSAAFIIFAVIILAAPIVVLFLNKAYVFGVLLTLLAIAILIPLLMLACFIRVYGYLYAVLGDLRIWTSIENAYVLFCKNLGASIIMGMIFVLFSIILGLSIIILLAPVLAALIALGAFLFLALKSIGVAIAIGIGAIIVLAITCFIRSVYETFAQTVWILFFYEIAKPQIEEAVIEEISEIKTTSTSDPVKTSESL